MSATKTVLTRAVQMTVHPGRPADNVASMLEAIATAKGDGVALLVFPEMAIPGYLVADEWEREAFLRECEACGEDIGVKRIQARPMAQLCIDCKGEQEQLERREG